MEMVFCSACKQAKPRLRFQRSNRDCECDVCYKRRLTNRLRSPNGVRNAIADGYIDSVRGEGMLAEMEREKKQNYARAAAKRKQTLKERRHAPVLDWLRKELTVMVNYRDYYAKDAFPTSPDPLAYYSHAVVALRMLIAKLKVAHKTGDSVDSEAEVRTLSNLQRFASIALSRRLVHVHQLRELWQESSILD